MTAMNLNMGEGRVGINKLSSLDATLDVAGTGQFTGTLLGATITGSLLRSSGDVVAYYSSDERLKDNMTPLQGALENVTNLNGYEFDWNSNQAIYKGHDVGVSAQEIQKYYPELVEQRQDGYLAVKYEKLVAVLISAIKELNNKVDNLNKK